jgi:hypothetical protein
MVKAASVGAFPLTGSILAFPAILPILAIRLFPPLPPFLCVSKDVALLRASASLTCQIHPLYNQNCCRQVVAQLLFCPIPFTVLAV